MSVPFNRTLRFKLPMMKGPDVRALQTQLHFRNFLRRADIDALYGPTTKRAVTDFQASEGLVADGIAGPDTFAALAGGAEPVPAPVARSRGAGPNPVSNPPVPLRTGRLLPADWMPVANMKRIILHWTAGSHTPSANDKAHYHILIDGEGSPHRGKHAITANVPPLKKKKYAAHTAGTNSHSIGLSICCMSNGRERPYDPGPFPITRAQWQAMAQAAAELCLAYGIGVKRTTVLGHGEVQDLLNRPQSGKWDPMVMPWEPGLPFREVGDRIRDDVRRRLDALRNPLAVDIANEDEELVPLEQVDVDGTTLTGTRFDGQDWIDLNALAGHLGWSGLSEVGAGEDVSFDTPPLQVAVERLKAEDGSERLWAAMAEVSDKAGLLIREDSEGALSLHSPPDVAEGAPQQVIVRAGQTLSQIARRWLGDANRWRELRDENGQAFDEESARHIRVGQLILLPAGAVAPAPAPAGGAPATDDDIAAIADRIAASAPNFVDKDGRRTMRRSAIAILEACNRHNVPDPSHQAYILATANHETNLGQIMIEKWVPTQTQRNYVGKLGNRTLAEAERYKGRGFVQVTGRSNYRRYGKLFDRDFLNTPELLENPDVAADVIVLGMSVHGFTRPGFVLADLGSDGQFDFFNARGLINGDKNKGGDSRYPGQTKGQGIADTARLYLGFINSV